MPLAAGTRLGPHEIEAPIGAGGMGEVYRARDTRLDRIVAIKVLPAQLAADPELRQRFEREARAISSLSHPHICALFDVGHQDGIDYLVMEYLEGETLAARLARGPLPLGQVLEFGIQMADALAQAHRQGVFHRDLKPGNVMLTRTGAKLLDFGLARMGVGGQGPGVGETRLSVMPTQVGTLTQKGTILGTLQYMAPEQLEGKGGDGPSDMFAFGAVLYEMATGKKAFEGKSQASVIAAILDTDPPPISSLQPMSPPVLDQVVKNCLAKNPEHRWQTAHDLKLQLQWIAESPAAPSPSRPAASSPRWWIAATLLFLLAAVGFAVAWFRRPAVEAPAMRFSVSAPEKSSFVDAVPVISPDGRRLAFTARASDGRTLLWVRPLDSLTAQPLAGTDGALTPFWSPDSRFLGFFAQNKLKKIEISGGPPLTLCDAPQGGGGAWNRDGVILFSMRQQPLHRVSAAGGPATPVTALDAAREFGHRWPEFLPDGRHFLYYVLSKEQVSHVYAGSLDAKPGGGAPKRLLGADSAARYASSSEDPAKGHLLFLRESALMAQPFDAGRLELAGDPFPVAEQMGVNIFGATPFSVSANGALAYTTGGGGNSQLAWFDRAGKPLGVVGAPARYNDVSLSPDQSRAAVVIGDRSGGTIIGDIWVVDLARNVSSRFTFAPGTDYLPVWAPDSGHIIFTANRDGGTTARSLGLYQKVATGAGDEEEVPVPKGSVYSQDWSSDGRYLLYCATDPKTQHDLWVLPLTGDRKPVPYLQTPFSESFGQFSPDVRWVAYASNETGVQQVYVQPFPASGGKWQITSGGGAQPRWRRDGRELFYIAPDRKLMAVSVKAGPAGVPAFGLPQELFQTRLAGASNNLVFLYAVAADGQRFLINTALEEAASTPITVVVNWTSGVKK